MTAIALLGLGLCVGIAAIILATILRRKIILVDNRKKCVFITGTDSGFGKTLALALDSKGVKVYAGCYTDQGIESLKLESTGNIKPIKVDVTDEKSLLAARMVIEQDLEDGQGLWGLVNNAGIATGLIFHISTLEHYKAIMDVNFLGVIRTTETFLPLIKKSRGRIINVGSSIRRCPNVLEPYSCSKVASGVYNDGLRRCMKDYGIHVCGIEPGIVLNTNMNTKEVVQRLVNANFEKLPDDIKKEYTSDFLQEAHSYAKLFGKLPLSSFNSTSMVANAIIHGLFAKYPKSSYICGYDAKALQILGLLLPDFIIDLVVRYFQRKYLRIIRANVNSNR